MQGIDTVWVLISTGLVLLMTPGLAFFYGGLVREGHAINTIKMSIVANWDRCPALGTVRV